jgi:hypothetical protein
MENSFVIRERLRAWDLYIISLYFLFRSRKFWWIASIIFLVIYINAARNLISSSKSFDGEVWFGLFAIAFLLILSFFWLLLLRCLLYPLFFPRVFKEKIYEFSSWGVVVKTEGLERSKPWRNFQKIKETRSFFLISLSNTEYVLILKRLFKKKGEAEAFKTFVSSTIAAAIG